MSVTRFLLCMPFTVKTRYITIARNVDSHGRHFLTGSDHTSEIKIPEVCTLAIVLSTASSCLYCMDVSSVGDEVCREFFGEPNSNPHKVSDS